MPQHKDLEQRILEDERLHELHKAVWRNHNYAGFPTESFNERAFFKFARAVDSISKDFPGLYAEYKIYVDMYDSMIKYR